MNYRPSEGPNFKRNRDKAINESLPYCFICGKSIKTPRYWARTLGGLELCSNDVAETNPAGDSGYVIIGSECYRSLPSDVKIHIYDQGTR